MASSTKCSEEVATWLRLVLKTTVVEVPLLAVLPLSVVAGVLPLAVAAASLSSPSSPRELGNTIDILKPTRYNAGRLFVCIPGYKTPHAYFHNS